MEGVANGAVLRCKIRIVVSTSTHDGLTHLRMRCNKINQSFTTELIAILG